MNNDAALRKLFAKRDRLAAELIAVDAQIAAAGRAYSEANGYRMTLRPERLRLAVGAPILFSTAHSGPN